jgi:hypothetical protein
MKLDWHKAKPITFEYLRGRYSYGDLVFAGLTIEGVLDGVLHLTGFMPKRISLFCSRTFAESHRMGKSMCPC